MPLPDPDLGWKILREFEAKIPEADRNLFISDARFLEGAFTSGHLSEEQYRSMLGEWK